MRLPIESDTFRTRLRQGLENIGFPSDSPSALAREFNRRHRGAPITADAARKWLLGEAIPTQAKLRSIAEWLAVSPEWLGFGGGEQGNPAPGKPAPGKLAPGNPAPAKPRSAANACVDLALIADLHLLDEPHRRLVRQFVRKLLELQNAQAKKGTGPKARML